MGMESPVQASWFYMDESEKIKFNWFLFEYACNLYDEIMRSRKGALRKWKAQRSEGQIAEFCAYFSKRMRKSALNQLAGVTEHTEGDEEYICDYCHTNTHHENVALLDVAGKAWEEMLDACIACPNRCVSERYERCSFFDRMERGGYFS
jgi:uncharacterized Fe-S radical SAM superfamily protein PflX